MFQAQVALFSFSGLFVSAGAFGTELHIQPPSTPDHKPVFRKNPDAVAGDITPGASPDLPDRPTEGPAQKLGYTTNYMCRPQYCINPVFPALSYFGENTFAKQEKRHWGCVDDMRFSNHTGFCARLLTYPFSLPAPEKEQMLVRDIVKQESREAIKMYAAHLAGMGLEFWEYTEPWNLPHDPCIQSVWKLVCYTYFPKCNAIEENKYLKPCKSACQTYVQKCKVDCCDDGLKCVFTHEKVLADGKVSKESGYSDHVGPSTLCTGY